jgi:hypothetical protein
MFGFGLANSIGSRPGSGVVPGWVNGIDATLDIDFINDRSWFGGVAGNSRSRLTVSRGSTATYTDVNGVMQTAAVDVARLDYHPVTHAAMGLLAEEGRTNYLRQSNLFSDAVWNFKTNVTLTAAAALGPDGTMSLTKIEATAGAATLLAQDCASAGQTSGVTGSVFVRKGSGATDANKFSLRDVTAGVDVAIATFNYDTGVLTVTTGSGGVVDYGGGLYRIWLLGNASAASNTMRWHVGFTGGAETAAEFAYFGFGQVERGAYASSYIPTGATTVARSSDNIDLNSSAFAYNPLAGTILCRARNEALLVGGVGCPWVLHNNSDDTNFIRCYFYYPVPLRMGGNSQNAGVAQWDRHADVSAVIAGFNKSAEAWIADNVAVSTNGSAAQTDTSASIVSGLTKLAIGRGRVAAHYLNGHVDRVTYWPYRKTDAQLTALSS